MLWARGQYRGKPLPFEVSENGEFRTLIPNRIMKIGRILKQNVNHGGYPTVICEGSKVTAHLIVAETWIGPKPDGLQVNHIDGNKKNNCYTNLEYVTAGENIKHAYAMGLMSAVGEKNGCAKLTENDVRSIRELWDEREHSIPQLAKKFNVGIGGISGVVYRRNWKHI